MILTYAFPTFVLHLSLYVHLKANYHEEERTGYKRRLQSIGRLSYKPMKFEGWLKLSKAVWVALKFS